MVYATRYTTDGSLSVFIETFEKKTTLDIQLVLVSVQFEMDVTANWPLKTQICVSEKVKGNIYMC